MASSCSQVFPFIPSKRYEGKILIELPLVVGHRDGRDGILTVLVYVVEADDPFL